MFSSKSDEWETPQWLFDELDSEFHFTLDPCASEQNHKCEKFYTKEVNGLSQCWKGENVFCNPPYGKEIGSWVRRCYLHGRVSGCVSVMLIPARTDTKWFHDYIYNKENVEVRFLKGRLKFGNANNSAPFPSMIVVFGEKGRNEELKIFENEVTILDWLIEHDKDIIADCDTEDDEFDDNKELAKLSLNDHVERKEAFNIAISALKEIQQYREIGTVEECKTAMDLQKHLEEADNNLYKILLRCSEYEQIGTVEECREAVEKQKAKKIVYKSNSVFSDGFTNYRIGKCPMCDRYYNSNDDVNCCSKCGQRLDFGGLI